MKSTSGHELLPFDEFYVPWFSDKDSESAEYINARYIVVVLIGFRFLLCPFLRVRIGIEIVQFFDFFQS